MYVFYSHFAGRGFKNIPESKYTKDMIFKQQLQEVEDGLTILQKLRYRKPTYRQTHTAVYRVAPITKTMFLIN